MAVVPAPPQVTDSIAYKGTDKARRLCRAKTQRRVDPDVDDARGVRASRARPDRGGAAVQPTMRVSVTVMI
jgi:hypothetical protein